MSKDRIKHKCCVDKCPNTSKNKKNKFFKFPGTRFRWYQRYKWILSIQRKNGSSWLPNASSVVCDAHFVGGEPSQDPIHEDYTPTIILPISNSDGLRCRSVSVKQFALEYIKYDALLERPSNANLHNEHRKCAYLMLARALRISVPMARSWERRFRDYFENKMTTLANQGKTKLTPDEDTPQWVMTVEARLHTLRGINTKQSRASRGAAGPLSPGGVVAALWAAARARGSLCCTPLYSEVRRALRLPTGLNDLHAVWVTAQRVSLEQVMCAGRAGDQPAAVPRDAARVADLVLLHTDVDVHRLVTDESLSLYEESAALYRLWQLARRHRLEDAAPRRSRVRAQRWARARADYVLGGREASLVVLQRRWHELKLQARARLAAHCRRSGSAPPLAPPTGQLEAPPPDTTPLPAPLHLDILKRYPHIATSPLVSWRQAVAEGLVITEPLENSEEELDLDTNDPSGQESESAEPENAKHESAETDAAVTELRMEDEAVCSSHAVVKDLSQPYHCSPENSTVDETRRDEVEPQKPSESSQDMIVPVEQRAASVDTDTEDNLVIDESFNNAKCMKQEEIEHTDANASNTVSINKGDEDTTQTIDVLHTLDPTAVKTEIIFDSDSTDEDEKKQFNDEYSKVLIPLDLKSEPISNSMLFDDERTLSATSEVMDDAEGNDDSMDKNDDNDRTAWGSDQDMDELVGEEIRDGLVIDSKLFMESCVNLIKVDETPTWKKYSFHNTSINISTINTELLSTKAEARNKIKRELIESETTTFNEKVPPKIARIDNKSDSDDDEPLLVIAKTNTKIESDSGDSSDVSNHDTHLHSKGKKCKKCLNESKICKNKRKVAEGNDGTTRKKRNAKIPFNTAETEDESSRSTYDSDNEAKDPTFTASPLAEAESTEGSSSSDVECIVNKGHKPRMWRPINGYRSAASTVEWSDKFDSVFGESVRVAKRVELPNIEEVRRVNSNILTAQVAPITAATGNSVNMNQPAIKKVPPDDSLPTGEQLESVLEDLSTAAAARRQLESAGACCAARRWRDVRDARCRIGLPPSGPHTHDEGECTCCCKHLCDDDERLRLNMQLKALHNDIANMLKTCEGKKYKAAAYASNDKKNNKNEKKRKMESMRKYSRAPSPSFASSVSATLTSPNASASSSASEYVAIKAIPPSVKIAAETEPVSAKPTSTEPTIRLAWATAAASSKPTLRDKPSTPSTPSISANLTSTQPNLAPKPSKSIRNGTRSSKSPSSTAHALDKPSTPASDDGYSEWIRQKNVNAQYFHFKTSASKNKRRKSTAAQENLVHTTEAHAGDETSSARSVTQDHPKIKLVPFENLVEPTAELNPDFASVPVEPTSRSSTEKFLENLRSKSFSQNQFSLPEEHDYGRFTLGELTEKNVSILEQFSRTFTPGLLKDLGPSNAGDDLLSERPTSVVMAITSSSKEVIIKTIVVPSGPLETVDLTSDTESLEDEVVARKKQTAPNPIAVTKVTSGPSSTSSNLLRRFQPKVQPPQNTIVLNNQLNGSGIIDIVNDTANDASHTCSANSIFVDDFAMALQEAAKSTYEAVYVYKRDAAVLTPAQLPCGSTLLCVDASASPLRLADAEAEGTAPSEFLVVTDDRLACRAPTYWTVTSYAHVTRVLLPQNEPGLSTATINTDSRETNLAGPSEDLSRGTQSVRRNATETPIMLEKTANETWRIVMENHEASDGPRGPAKVHVNGKMGRGAPMPVQVRRCMCQPNHNFKILTAVSSAQEFRHVVALKSALFVLDVHSGRWFPLRVTQSNVQRRGFSLESDSGARFVTEDLERLLNEPAQQRGSVRLDRSAHTLPRTSAHQRILDRNGYRSN